MLLEEEEEEEERNRITSSLAITLLDPPEEETPVSFSEATTASTKRFKDSDGDDFTNVFSFNKRNADGHILLLIVVFVFVEGEHERPRARGFDLHRVRFSRRKSNDR